VASVDYAVCRTCPNGAMQGPGRGSRPDRCAAACVRACIVQLEGKGKLKQTFANPFRKRKPWALDVYNRPIEHDGAAGKLGCDDLTGYKKA
jgi:hypothetical protein